MPLSSFKFQITVSATNCRWECTRRISGCRGTCMLSELFSIIIILKWTIKSNNLENHSTRIGGQAVWSKWEIIEYRKKVPIQNHKAIHRYLRGNFQSHFICCPSIFSKWSLQETEVLSKTFLWTRHVTLKALNSFEGRGKKRTREIQF